MGFWTGIKYALNSTLGTSNFKSLDKIIEEKLSTITNKLNTLSSDTEKVRTATGTTATLASTSREYGGSSTGTILYMEIAPITGMYTLQFSVGQDATTVYKVKDDLKNKYYNAYSAGSGIPRDNIDTDFEYLKYGERNSSGSAYFFAQAGEPIIIAISIDGDINSSSIKYKG